MPLNFSIQLNPAFLEQLPTDDPLGHGHLWLLMQWVVAKVNSLRLRLGLIRAPGFAPQPLLRQRVDAHIVLGVIGQILIEVGEAVRVGRQLLVVLPELVPHELPPEAAQVDDVQGRDVVRLAAEVLLPEPGAPEREAEGRFAGVAHGGVAVGGALEVEVPELLEVAAHDLIGVDVDDLLDIKGEERVKEKDFVSPDQPLLLALAPEPLRPLVRHKVHLAPNLLRHGSGRGLERRRQEIFEEPKLHLARGALRRRKHHDLQEPLVQVPGREGEHVDRVVVPVPDGVIVVLAEQLRVLVPLAPLHQQELPPVHEVLHDDGLGVRGFRALVHVDHAVDDLPLDHPVDLRPARVLRDREGEDSRLGAQLPVSRGLHDQGVRVEAVAVARDCEQVGDGGGGVYGGGGSVRTDLHLGDGGVGRNQAESHLGGLVHGQLQAVGGRSLRDVVALPEHKEAAEAVLDLCEADPAPVASVRDVPAPGPDVAPEVVRVLHHVRLLDVPGFRYVHLQSQDVVRRQVAEIGPGTAPPSAGSGGRVGRRRSRKAQGIRHEPIVRAHGEGVIRPDHEAGGKEEGQGETEGVADGAEEGGDPLGRLGEGVEDGSHLHLQAPS
mmetsp:Transcript_17106/g.35117  ORF Transcript_17106/g.35117 Transcript_17106/m.35117 type:complete len:606 (+) Transcript_17106:146-1963(+)